MSDVSPEMDDFSADPMLGAALPEQERMLWTRIQLDFGPSGIELEEEPEEAEVPVDRIRQELEQMIGAIRDAAQAASEEQMGEDDLARMESLLNEPGKLEELVAQVAEEERLRQPQGSADSAGQEADGAVTPAAEAGEEQAGESAAGEPDTAETDPTETSSAEPDTSADEAEEEDAEFEEFIRNTTAEDAINALMLLAIDRDEVLVHENLEYAVNLYVLCVLDGDILRTVHMDESGSLTYGVVFDDFIEAILVDLPVRGIICTDGDSYSYSAPVTALGEELALSADGTCAALVEAPMGEIPSYVSQAQVAGPVYAAPADKGWSLISTDPVSLGNLLNVMRVPSIVAELAEGMEHLAFIFPGTPQNFEDQTVGQWLSTTLGTTPESDDLGTIIEFAWGAPKTLMRFVPQGSRALDYLWLLPGVLPEPLATVRATEDVDSLAWLYGLDEQTTNRFSNYVFDSSSETGLESVIQALSLPEELAKVLEDSTLMAGLTGFQEFGPDMSGLEIIKETVTAYPNGTDTLSSINRELRARPWVFAADGALQLGASGALAVWAARRVARGQSGRGPAALAATLGAAGIAELVLARAYSRLKEGNLVGEEEAQPVSLLDELKQARQAPEPTPEKADAASSVAPSRQQVALGKARELGELAHIKAQDLGGRLGQQARGTLRRFFGL